MKKIFFMGFILLNTFQDSSAMIAQHLKQNRSLKEIKQLLIAGHDINKPYDGDTPLHFVCRKEKLKILKFLLTMPTLNINAKKRNGDTALHLVAKEKESEKRIAIFKELLTHKDINVHKKNRRNRTPLTIACHKRNGEIMALLLQHDPSLMQRSTFVYDLFQIFLYYSHQKINTYLLSPPGITLFAHDNNNNNFLHFACFYQSTGLIDMILDAYKKNNKLDLINQQNCDGNTPLHNFLRYYPPISDVLADKYIKNLLDTGANPLIKNHTRYTPFFCCNVIDRLDQENVDRMIRGSDENGNNHLHFCAEIGSLHSAEKYINFLVTQKKLSVWTRNKKGEIAADINRNNRYSLLRATSAHISCATFKEIFKNLLPEIQPFIMRYYYILNRDTIFARLHRDAIFIEDPDGFIKNFQQPHLLWRDTDK